MDQRFVNAPERFFAVEVDGSDELDAVLEGVVGEADGLGSVGEVLEGLWVHVADGVHVLGDGNESTVDATQGFTPHVDGGELDGQIFFIRDTHVVGERSGADACEEVREG